MFLGGYFSSINGCDIVQVVTVQCTRMLIDDVYKQITKRHENNILLGKTEIVRDK